MLRSFDIRNQDLEPVKVKKWKQARKDGPSRDTVLYMQLLLQDLPDDDLSLYCFCGNPLLSCHPGTLSPAWRAGQTEDPLREVIRSMPASARPFEVKQILKDITAYRLIQLDYVAARKSLETLLKTMDIWMDKLFVVSPEHLRGICTTLELTMEALCATDDLGEVEMLSCRLSYFRRFLERLLGYMGEGKHKQFRLELCGAYCHILADLDGGFLTGDAFTAANALLRDAVALEEITIHPGLTVAWQRITSLRVNPWQRAFILAGALQLRMLKKQHPPLQELLYFIQTCLEARRPQLAVQMLADVMTALPGDLMLLRLCMRFFIYAYDKVRHRIHFWQKTQSFMLPRPKCTPDQRKKLMKRIYKWKNLLVPLIEDCALRYFRFGAGTNELRRLLPHRMDSGATLGMFALDDASPLSLNTQIACCAERLEVRPTDAGTWYLLTAALCDLKGGCLGIIKGACEQIWPPARRLRWMAMYMHLAATWVLAPGTPARTGLLLLFANLPGKHWDWPELNKLVHGLTMGVGPAVSSGLAQPVPLPILRARLRRALTTQLPSNTPIPESLIEAAQMALNDGKPEEPPLRKLRVQ